MHPTLNPSRSALKLIGMKEGKIMEFDEFVNGNIVPIISVVAYLMQRTDALTAEIASLKGRIARLEGGETHVDGSQKTE